MSEIKEGTEILAQGERKGENVFEARKFLLISLWVVSYLRLKMIKKEPRRSYLMDSLTKL